MLILYRTSPFTTSRCYADALSPRGNKPPHGIQGTISKETEIIHQHVTNQNLRIMVGWSSLLLSSKKCFT